jgi:hypothetical protein
MESWLEGEGDDVAATVVAATVMELSEQQLESIALSVWTWRSPAR